MRLNELTCAFRTWYKLALEWEWRAFLNTLKNVAHEILRYSINTRDEKKTYQAACSGQSKEGSLITPFSSTAGLMVKTNKMCAARMKSVDWAMCSPGQALAKNKIKYVERQFLKFAITPPSEEKYVLTTKTEKE